MSSYPIPLAIYYLALLVLSAQANVPPSEQFRFVNEGDFGENPAEYGSDYRALDPLGYPFRLCFYNTTPNAFTLAIRMATESSESIMRWVWEANRGKLVGEGATLTFGQDGNLVLADTDGQVVWQTNTANKGVVRLKLQENGNLVLYDAQRKFVWQSFDYPTDTLLVGQSLRPRGPNNKLVSRASYKFNTKGPYSLILESKRLVLYYINPNTNKSSIYYVREGQFDPYSTLFAERDEGTSTQLGMLTPGLLPQVPTKHYFDRPNYNATWSFLRLDIDGNLRIYTFDFQVSWRAWEVTFALFNREDDENECMWPERCGELGLCEDSQCVACPSEKGLLGWSKSCKTKKITSCDPKAFRYYKLEGVVSFMTKYMAASVVEEKECGNKCTKDCECLGYFYNRASSKCWIAYELKTLAKVPDLKQVAFIKTSKYA